MLRAFARSAILSALGRLRYPAAGVHILNGHYVSRARSSPEVFRTQLRELATFGRLVRAEVAIAMRLAGEQPSRALFAFTFDDGFEECYSLIAPILEEFGVNGAFFINPGFVDGDPAYVADFARSRVASPGKRPMDWDQIRDLAIRGHIIGAHTIDHLRLVGNEDAVIEHQVVHCRTVIEERTRKSCDYFAWPYGRLLDISAAAQTAALRTYAAIFASDKYANETEFLPRVVNRRHFEGDWPVEHLRYFLGKPPHMPAAGYGDVGST